MCIHSGVVRGLSGLSPCRRYLLPVVVGPRDLWPVRLVHGELSYVRQDLNGKFINDAACISRAREGITFTADHVFNSDLELLLDQLHYHVLSERFDHEFH